MKRLVLLAACFGITLGRAQVQEVSKQDREFAEYAQMANLMEQKLSEMALRKGFSPEVKELAQHVIEDNKRADELLRVLAANRSITILTKLDDKHQKDYDKLSDKVGEDFDKCYTERMLKEHKDAADAYEKEAKKGENTELRAFATNALPNVIHHKNMSDETCKKLKKKDKEIAQSGK
jgi:putative membrane protein